MTLRTVIYARFSTDLQRDVSIEDQLRVCRSYAEQQGWRVVDSYSDRAISGASMLRPGLQDLIADAAAGRFDIVLAEAMDRISRDQEDIAGLFKRLNFVGVMITTLAEGQINEMHIGLKGTMNALFLKDLAAKTHRGLRGRVEAGKSGGGNSYGYKVIRRLDADGVPIAGEREVDPAQAAVVRRIFRDFAAGLSPRAIAHSLNAERTPGPRDGTWGQSTINGNAERGTGILNNELYAGKLVWNRLRYVKDPSTGKRVSRPNPLENLVVKDVPGLRIVDEELWHAVKARQIEARKLALPDHRAAQRANPSDSPGPVNRPRMGFWANQRPRHLLTGLMRCGVCGGAYTKLNTTSFGCATARNKGTCDNRITIRTDAVDNIVLSGLKARLMDPTIYHEFVDAFIAERNAILAQQNAKYNVSKAELVRIKSRQKTLIQALADGIPARTVKDEMIALEAKEDELNALLANQPTQEPALHPNLAHVYRERVAALHTALADPHTRDEAFTIIRTLVDEVRLVPENGTLRVELRGALAGILSLASCSKPHVRVGMDGSVSVLVEQIKLVAGDGFEPTTFRLWA